MKSFFSNARVIGEQVDPERYRVSVDGEGKQIQRGDPRLPMSRGALSDIAECPARWLKGYARTGTDATEWGTRLDCRVLSPERFANHYVTAPETYPCEPTKRDPRTEKPWNRNATFCDEWEAEQLADGLEVLKKSEAEKIEAAHTALMADADIAELLACSRRQVMVVGEYQDNDTGIIVPVKILLDLVPDAGHEKFGRCLADFKTSMSAARWLWPKFCAQRGYDTQSAMYLDLYVAATGEDRTDWLHAIQESYPPYETGKRLLGEGSEQAPGFIALGRTKYRNALKLYCRCLATGHWPGYDADGHLDDWTLCEPDAWMVRAAMESTPALEIPPDPYDETDVPQ